MKKVYLLAYDDGLGTRDQVKEYLNKIESITHWRYDLPHCFYVVSKEDADDLSDHLREVSGKGKFIFVEITHNHQGWLNEETWHLINNKDYKPKLKKP